MQMTGLDISLAKAVDALVRVSRRAAAEPFSPPASDESSSEAGQSVQARQEYPQGDAKNAPS